jgi:hypothetical protein
MLQIYSGETLPGKVGRLTGKEKRTNYPPWSISGKKRSACIHLSEGRVECGAEGCTELRRRQEEQPTAFELSLSDQCF